MSAAHRLSGDKLHLLAERAARRSQPQAERGACGAQGGARTAFREGAARRHDRLPQPRELLRRPRWNAAQVGPRVAAAR